MLSAYTTAKNCEHGVYVYTVQHLNRKEIQKKQKYV